MALSEFPERIKRLDVTIAGNRAGELLRESTYVFKYDRDDAAQPAVSLLMPPSRALYEDGDLFPSMDMNLPEGFLFMAIRERHPKQVLTKMHLLALIGDNGIGRVGFALDQHAPPVQATVDRQTLLRSTAGPQLFGELVDAYLSMSAGVSGVQPKLMLPTRTMVPIPDVIVKLGGPDYPGLSSNEFLCMEAARRAGIEVSTVDLSADGSILVVDRFDIDAQGRRIGFEDIAALMGRQVYDRLSNRKYEGSYDNVAEIVHIFSAEPARDLARLYDQIVLSVMVRNGDAHLKNFGLLYTGAHDARLAPLFDVVTTTIYTYQRPGGVESVDRTLALKLRAGKHGSRAYPDTETLLRFGREVCGVRRPQQVIDRIAQAMRETLTSARADARIDARLLEKLTPEWESGLGHAPRAAH